MSRAQQIIAQSKKTEKKGDYLAEIPFNIGGVPCLIGLTSFSKDDDYDMEYDILDRKGYHAKWLEAKLTKDIKAKIEKAVYAHRKEINSPDY